MHEHQIFSTMSPRRWRIVKWTTSVLLGFVVLGLGIMAMTLAKPNKPELPKNFTKCTLSPEQMANDTTISWQASAMYAAGCCHERGPRLLTPLSNPARVPLAQQIRAGFYMNWDDRNLQSFYSMRDNIEKLNMVIPGWLTLGKTDTVICEIDTMAFQFLQKHPSVTVLPMITNCVNQVWSSENVRRIIQDSVIKHKYIENIVSTLKRYGFQGINIDIENLDETLTEDFHVFMKDLYGRLHTEGFLVSQEIIPFTKQFAVERVNEYNDLLFVMAYNQHYETGVPGPIASQKWVERVMDSVSAVVPNDKFVLCIPTFGLDWGKKGQLSKELTYKMAISVAKEADARIKYNSTTYNLEFEYSDDDKVPHKVFFTDAATNFNAIRAVDNFGWRGVCMWRLGAEDSRVWEFYKKDLSLNALKRGSFDAKTLSTTIPANDVTYVGYGEVMDILTEPKPGSIRFQYDSIYHVISEEYYLELPTSYVVQRYGKSDNKKLVLTFDDGPDEKYTPQVLDILKKEHVPGAFFLIGGLMEKNPDITKRIFKEGHEIGNHTFTHPDINKIWDFQAQLELIRTRRSIESLTGSSTLLFRPPYNPYPEPRKREELQAFILAREHNYLTVNESIDPLDWKAGMTADSIFNRVVRKVDSSYGHIILLHDAGGKREATIEALPRIIQHFKKRGFQFVSIADLMGKKRADLMPVVEKDQKALVQLNRGIMDFSNWITTSLDWIFYLAVYLAIFRVSFIFYFAMKQKWKDDKETLPDFTPPLSIIVPAYNEEMGATSTIASLLNQNYPNFEVVFVDDGSKDKTFENVKAAYGNHAQVQVLTKPNGGKASALNFGLKKCKSDFVVCIDADTQLDPNAIREIAKPFADPKVGAVAGNVKVGNQINWLTKWQSIEYITAQNFDRMAFAYLNCITVVPGAIGAFRRKAIGAVGWYETDTLAEDCDLTMRIIRKGYRVAQNNNSIAITESPETLKQFLKQRFRWTFGVMQAFWKSKHVLFNKRYGSLGWVALPNILIFGMILPIFAPIADLVLLLSVLSSAIKAIVDVSNSPIAPISFYEQYHTLILYLAFMGIDLLVSAVALRIQKEPLRQLWLLFPQRLVYRPLMYYVLFKSYIKALKGELMGWGVLKRTGSIGQVVVKQPMPTITQEDIELNKIPSVG